MFEHVCESRNYCVGECGVIASEFSKHAISPYSVTQCLAGALYIALKLLVSLISRLVAYSARIVVDTDRQAHRPSTVTLAGHARRGLIMIIYSNLTYYIRHKEVHISLRHISFVVLA